MTLPYPATVEHRRDARNGMYPCSSFYNQAVYAENHITAFRKKQVFQWRARLGDIANVGSTGGTVNHSRFRCHVGYGTTRLVAYAIMGPANPSGTDPYVSIDATIAGGATSTFSPDMHTGTNTTAASDVPSQWQLMRSEVMVTANTTYEVLVKQIDYARILALSIFEEGDGVIDTSIDYFNDLTVPTGRKIYDSHRERLIGLSSMWKRNGALQCNWGREGGATRTRTSATAINLVDNTTTGTPTANSPGWKLDLQYRTTRSRAVVPCVLAVYGSMSSGSGTVRITDTSAASPIAVTVNSATPGWFTATGDIVASAAKKYDPMFLSDGANTLTVYAVSLYEYEA